MADESLERVGRQWLETRAVVVAWMKDFGAGVDATHREGLAASLLARLAQHDPPLLLAYPEELKG